MTNLGKHAVVMGGSMAGLLSAEVLAQSFEKVTVVERDADCGLAAGEQLADSARKGVPQGRHLHVLLAAGFASLQRTLPGFRAAALARGAVEVDMGSFGTLYLGGVLMPSITTGNTSLMFSRPAIEGCVRACVLARGNLSLRSGSVHALLGDRGAITGVRMKGADPAQFEDLPADLVVDATGRGSRVPTWLASLGLAPPREDVVRNKLSYSSCTIRRKAEHLGGAHAWIMTPVPPLTHFGAAQAWEGERYIVSFTTYLGERGPQSYPEMIEHARALAFPGLYELLRNAEPLTDTVQLHVPENRRRRYEKMGKLPRGLLVVGDALCAFNPAYGQGMSVTALEAEALAACLRRRTPDLAREFFSAAAKIVDAPWMLATGADFQWREVEGKRPLGTALINRYVARVIQTAGEDPMVADRLLRVLHLLMPPTRLFAPDILRRVLFRKPRLSLTASRLATLDEA